MVGYQYANSLTKMIMTLWENITINLNKKKTYHQYKTLIYKLNYYNGTFEVSRL